MDRTQLIYLCAFNLGEQYFCSQTDQCVTTLKSFGLKFLSCYDLRQLKGNIAQNRYHLRWLTFNTVRAEVTTSCVQHVTYFFLNAFNFMVKSFYVIFSLFLIGFVRNPQIVWRQQYSNSSLTVYQHSWKMNGKK